MPVTRARLRDEGGFTLIELTVAMSVGIVVLFALYTLVDRALPATARITGRVSAQQRGRTALERMERELRSSVCIRTSQGTGASATYLTPFTAPSNNTQVTFYTYLPTPFDTIANPQTFLPQQRQLTYDPVAGTISETTWTTAGTVPSLTFSNPVTQVVLTNVSQKVVAGVTQPVFSYYAYSSASSPPQQVFPAGSPATLSATDQARVAELGIAFVVAPATTTSYAGVNASFDDNMTLRIPADFSSDANAANGPVCQI